MTVLCRHVWFFYYHQLAIHGEGGMHSLHDLLVGVAVCHCVAGVKAYYASTCSESKHRGTLRAS